MTEASRGGASSGDSGAGFVDVGPAEELARRPLQSVMAGRTRIALVYRDGRFSAISGVCNHVGGPLGDGTLDGEWVVCPWHHWKFHCESGRGEPGYENDQVPTHVVDVRAGRVFVAVQASTPRRKHAHAPHPLATLIRRGEPGGPALDAPLRVLGISPVNDHALAKSVEAGRVVEHTDAKPTLSDGTAGGIEPGSITLPLAAALVDDWVLVTEDEIRDAMRQFIARESMLLEGAAGAAIAGVLKRAKEQPSAFRAKSVAILICGARIDLKKLASVVG